jgi:hypothetical protein
MTDTEIIDWLELQARKSNTGISFDWVPHCDGDPSGFRFMRRFFIGEARPTLRAAIRDAARMSSFPATTEERRSADPIGDYLKYRTNADQQAIDAIVASMTPLEQD